MDVLVKSAVQVSAHCPFHGSSGCTLSCSYKM